MYTSALNRLEAKWQTWNTKKYEFTLYGETEA